MKIYGIDFTSSPSARKPIACAKGNIKKNGTLIIDDIELIQDFSIFEKFLNSKGPWVAGFDFPFGLPLSFIHELKFKQDWEYYVKTICQWEKKNSKE
tara:strand:- start:1038 stop:1328 length:291 start_codon:yes stop_codon:yes gene_type:complete